MKSARLAAGAFALALVAGPAAAATNWYVATTGTDSPTCGTTTSPCKTIQHAIDLTDDGDTVIVATGTYAECIVVVPGTGPGAITLVAAGYQTGSTPGLAVLDGTGVCDVASAAPGPVVTVNDLSTVSGFGIINGGRSGVRGLGAVTISFNIISGNTTDGNGGGVSLTTGSFLTDPTKSALIGSNSIHDNTAQGDGGGVFVDASAAGVASVATVDTNGVFGNTAGSAGGFAFTAHGGGIAVITDTASDTDTSTVAVTGNSVHDNTVKSPTGGAISTGGGIFVRTAGINGLGTESVTVGGTGTAVNAVRLNTSEGIGGGISVVMAPRDGAADTITVVGNDVSVNTGRLGGGGIHAQTIASDLSTGTSALHLDANMIIGNFAQSRPADPAAVGGGGLYLDASSFRSASGLLALDLTKNQIRGNHTIVFGAGATLSLFANDDPQDDGATAPSAVALTFENNLIATNDGGTAGTAFGGGVAVFARSRGAQSTVTATQRFLTVEANVAPAGAGGIDWSALSEADSIGGVGAIALELSNSIVQGNDGFGVGGSVVPGGAITTTVAYNDALGNVAGDYAPGLGASSGTNGNISVDPGLDTLYVPLLCSLTIDAGDPALSPANEPEPNGNRVNIGHLGNSIDAARTLPDVNGDGVVDGLDVMGIAVSFNAASGDPRYFAAADRDFSGLIDGDDLAYVAAFFAQSCTAPTGSTP
ncbi:MAG TPA: hypothetical protein VFV19_00365 [Candidatus Polarisedimenticolaceae bacterium]|nr:hypothetical protein [Candidatus Polarisedimenticolaceae bacterium]